MVGEFLQSVVEFMIAEYADIISHHVGERIFYITAEEFEIERPLDHITGVDEDDIVVGAADAVDYGFALEDASAPFGVGLYGGVGVVGMQDHKVLCSGREGGGNGKDRHGQGGRGSPCQLIESAIKGLMYHQKDIRSSPVISAGLGRSMR